MPGIFLHQWGNGGTANGHFNEPAGVAVGAGGNVYVVDTFYDRIQVFTGSGDLIDVWGGQDQVHVNFFEPFGVAVGGTGNVYVADGNNHRVQVFDGDGTFLYAWGSEGSGEGQFGFPQGAALDAAGNVYVSDRDNNRIQVFSSSGFLLDDAEPDDGDNIASTFTIDDLASGSYTVSESVPADWALTDVTCDGGDWSADLENASVTVNLDGEDVTCTFSNRDATQVDIASAEDFVVLGLEGVLFGDNARVLSGHVGANNAGAQVIVGKNARLSDSASALFGDSLVLNKNVRVFDAYYNELYSNGAVNGTHNSPLSLPLLTTLPETPGFTPGTDDVNVAKNRSVTLEAGDYGELEVNQNATVVFSGGVYNFAAWHTGKNVKVHFLAPTEIRIAGELQIGQNGYVGPAPGANGLSAADVAIIVMGSNEEMNAGPAAAQFGKNVRLTANVYVPDGTLSVGQNARVTGAVFGKWIVMGNNASLTLGSGF